MKLSTIIIITTFFYLTNSFSQSFNYLHYNNVKARLTTNGVFFNDKSTGNADYTVPANQDASVIYASAFWFGGLDGFNNLHLSATKYGTNQDLFCGPIAANYTDATYLSKFFENSWSIDYDDIDTHLQNYNTVGYVVPSEIEDWPAHGNTANGEGSNLAPFIDVNHNGIYDPLNGDYPNIRGHRAVYLIFNDAAGVHSESGGEALGMEFHFMFYQYAANDDMNNTTFINLKVINRSPRTYTNFKVGQFTDGDLGNYSDDYFGSSPEKKMIYTYNGDAVDESLNQNFPNGFEQTPPAVGIKLLNHQMDVSGYFTSGVTANQSDPTTAGAYWGFMNAEWGSSGQHFTEGGTGIGGTVNTNYLMSSNPNDATGWSEQTELAIPGDRRMFMASEGVMISPNEYICYDYAVVYARAANNLISVDSLYVVADYVQAFYDAQSLYTCESVVLGVNEKPELSVINIYPNPNNGQFSIQGLKKGAQIYFYSIDGKLLEVINSTQESELAIDFSKYHKGNYLIKIIQNDEVLMKKIIIK